MYVPKKSQLHHPSEIAYARGIWSLAADTQLSEFGNSSRNIFIQMHVPEIWAEVLDFSKQG